MLHGGFGWLGSGWLGHWLPLGLILVLTQSHCGLRPLTTKGRKVDPEENGVCGGVCGCACGDTSMLVVLVVTHLCLF